MLAIAFLLQVELALTKSINWDEFHHFSQIHRHLQGRPMQWLQIPFVWLYSWVPSLPGDNISHIQLIRLLILPFELVTVVAIVASARHFVSLEEALFCGLLFVTGGYVFLHAFALRADMIAASLLTVALWIGIARPLRILEVTCISALLILAFISTIKSILYAPAFLGVALYRIQAPVNRWATGIVAAVLIGAGFLFLLKAPLLSEFGLSGTIREIGELGRGAIDRMFSAGFFPQERWLRGQIASAPVLTAALALAVIAIFQRERSSMEKMLLAALVLPLCTVAIYRNSYPYHFAFILPPAVIATAPAARILLQRYGVIPPAALLLAIAAVLSVMQDRRVMQRQRLIQAGIHEIFVDPVTYIDDCGVLGDFPRAINHYASGWALASYRHKGLASYRTAMTAEPVPLLLADSGLLGTVCFDLLYRGVLLREDHVAIRENFVQHWGNAYVAGKQIPAGNHTVTFHIITPGKYTVEGGTLEIDGIAYRPGSVLELSRGEHAASGSRSARVVLRWGDHLPRPAYPWPAGTIFTEF